MNDQTQAAARLAAWVVVLIGALLCLDLLGSGAMAAPPLGAGADALQRWLDSRGPAIAVFALVRLGAVVFAWYLLGTAVAAVVLRAAGVLRAAAVVESLSLPVLRRLVQAAVGLSFAASTLAPAGAVTPATGPAGASTAVDAAAAGAAPTQDEVLMTPLPEEEVVMRRLPDEGDTRSSAGTPWTVRKGDHFWRVAEEVLAAAWGRRPSDQETTGYWRQLVEANRGRLVDRDNPDLLIPGQILEVPDPPAAPG